MKPYRIRFKDRDQNPIDITEEQHKAIKDYIKSEPYAKFIFVNGNMYNTDTIARIFKI